MCTVQRQCADVGKGGSAVVGDLVLKGQRPSLMPTVVSLAFQFLHVSNDIDVSDQECFTLSKKGS